MTNQATFVTHESRALAHVYTTSMEYMTDHQVSAEEVKAFVNQHIDDFEEMIQDFISSRV